MSEREDPQTTQVVGGSVPGSLLWTALHRMHEAGWYREDRDEARDEALEILGLDPDGGPDLLTDFSYEPEPDPVNFPPHYRQGEVECIDAIRAALGPDGFAAYCRGQVIKYTWRAPHKGNAVEDLGKAGWYLSRLIDELESQGPTQPASTPLCAVEKPIPEHK